jgi:hypothetical protein
MRQSDVFGHLRTEIFSFGWHDIAADHGVVAGLTLQRRQGSDDYEVSAVLFPYSFFYIGDLPLAVLTCCGRSSPLSPTVSRLGIAD